MVKLKAKENFSLGRFAEIKNLVRANGTGTEGRLGKNDIFECEEDLAKYLTNEIKNPVNRAVVEVIEVIPKKVVREPVEIPVETESKPKTTRTKKTVAKK